MGLGTTETHGRAQQPGTRVVGIGASAGGLAPIEAFLAQTLPGAGIAYVVVQHLAPTDKPLLAELLERVTPMPVYEVTHRMRVKPDSVYVIKAGSELTLVNDILLLGESDGPRGMRLPIDVFFTSLAADQKARAIAVVLSGMGADGTLGLQAVKAAGGLSAVQQPDTAQFDSMPQSAIAAGCADIIAAPGDLPRLIMARVDAAVASEAAVADKGTPAPREDSLTRILMALKRKTRHDFSLYKRSTVSRRIERRMTIHNISALALYADLLESSDQEVELLFQEMLIGVTEFFRDPAVWQFLKDVALPDLLARRSGESRLRAWVVGCSTGEEAISLAITFVEATQKQPQYRDMGLQIFASDISQNAIETARRGRFSKSIEAKLSPDRLARFFNTRGDYYEIKARIRNSILFATQDVILDPPFTRLDLVLCRNLLIYFDAKLQQRLLPLFHYSLRPDSLLLLGSSETVGSFTNLFAPVQFSLRVFKSRDVSADLRRGLHVGSFPPLLKMSEKSTMPTKNTPPPAADGLQKAADQVLLQLYAPAAVVINSDGDIVNISGRTGKYLEPAAGKANWNFHAMVRAELRSAIASALKKAALQAEPVILHGLSVKLPGGAKQSLDVTVQSLNDPAELRGLTIIIFKDIELIAQGDSRQSAQTISETSHTAEMQQHSDEIQTLREEARATKEALQSSNEELQSTNEELQSTNEELTTSREEMQSMNEELQTINAEMRSKLDDLSLAQSDLKNLLNSIEIAILFLDGEMNVRRFTDRAAKIINIRDSDVGRPLTDLTTSLKYPELQDDAKETLRTLVFSEKQVETEDGKEFLVRIMPYRRLDNMIDGVVITLIDVTASK